MTAHAAKRGRPRTLPANMTVRFMIRCTPEDLETWRAAAETHSVYRAVVDEQKKE